MSFLQSLQLPSFLKLQDSVPSESDDASSDPIEAITETTAQATEAATEFVDWIGSGELEALIALGLVVALTGIQLAARWAILKGIVKLPQSDDYSFAALLQRFVRSFHTYFMVVIAFAITDAMLGLPQAVSVIVKIFFVLAAILQIAEWVQEFAVSFIRRNVARSSGDARALASAFNIIKWFITVAVWSVALLLILDNVGADVTALLAGLGIGGIAIGIAAQGTFRDLFSSLSIVIDKPFQVGDTVRYGDSWGIIEEIGLKTTRIRSRSGEQMIISNTNLLDYEIHNMQRMARRRIETAFGVIYQTDPDLAEKVPEIVAEIVKDVPAVTFDYCGMSAFGPSSLDFDLVFYSLQPDFNRSMAARSRVLLALFRGLQDHGLEFAYPTQTLFIEAMDEKAA
ncbi:MAG: mechanosensitive ion channel domain-containing protein [Pseudomonadota bacterium]|nr:mechanosensitive ion channel domain-containing protein [Pseudomonadota bacterium]